jgi:hypothetical protein
LWVTLLVGQLSGLLKLRLRWLALLYAAVAIQLVEFYVPAVHDAAIDGLSRLFVATIFGLVIVWLSINLREATLGPRVAYGLVAGGLGLNGLCLLVNGRMPFWLPAARAAGLPERLLHQTSHVKNVGAGSNTHLMFMGDIIPVPGIAKVFSVGDVAIAVGVFVLIVVGMRRQALTRQADIDLRKTPTGS